MTTTGPGERFTTLERRVPLADYNYAHFRTTHLLHDADRTLRKRGVQPGELAPDFELPRTYGGTLRLSETRDRPVLLRFGSPT